MSKIRLNEEDTNKPDMESIKTITEKFGLFLQALKSYEDEIKQVLRTYGKPLDTYDLLLGRYEGDEAGKLFEEIKLKASTEKFYCLGIIDNIYKTTITPLIKGIFEENPFIREGIGEREARAIYEKYKGTPSFKDTTKPLRISGIECQKDVLDIFKNSKNVETLRDYGEGFGATTGFSFSVEARFDFVKNVMLDLFEYMSKKLSCAESEKKDEEKVQTPFAQPDKKVTPDNTFCLKGKMWEIAFNKTEPIYLNDYKGFHFIKCLLSQPYKELNVLELVRLVEKPQTDKADIYNDLSGEEMNEEGLSVSSSLSNKQTILDQTSKEEIKKCIKTLDEKIEEAQVDGDIEKAEELQKKKAQLEKELSSKKGLYGRDRDFTNPQEKARKAVSKAVNEAIEAIPHEATAYQHFIDSIKVGVVCSYTPKKPTDWQF